MLRRNRLTSPWWRQFVLDMCQKYWKQELNNFLRQYRNSPYTSTGVNHPFTLMFSRETRTILPQISTFAHLSMYEVSRQIDEHAKLKMKTNNLGQDIKSIDTMSLSLSETKLGTNWHRRIIRSLVLLNAKGTMISVALCYNPLAKCVTRNALFFIKIRRQDDIQPQFSEEVEEDEVTTTRIHGSRRTSTHPTEEISKESVPNGTVTNLNATKERPCNKRFGRTVRQPKTFKDFVFKWHWYFYRLFKVFV